MSRPGNYDTGRDLEDGFQNLLSTLARFLFFAGLLATLCALGFLVYYATIPQGSAPPLRQAEGLIATFSSILTAGLVAVSIGAAFTFWGEEIMPALLIIGAGLTYFAPLLVPMATGGQTTSVGQASLSAVQSSGILFGGIAICILVLDLAVRARERANRGAKADALRYGKGIKEEKGVSNVFMGKCWQLPFCRKFVRERCPIYHARRTCWRERVGCMCEEGVIQGALENRPIPRDSLAAAQYIPKNNKLTLEQKKERCRSCVIYNEHQKHKYKLTMPIILAAFVAIYVVFRGPLIAMTTGVIERIDQTLGRATLRGGQVGIAKATEANVPFQEFLLICLFIVALTYVMRTLEYLIFKAKV